MAKRVLTILCCVSAGFLSAQTTVIDHSTAEKPAAAENAPDKEMSVEKVKTPRPYTFVKLYRSNADPELYAEPADAADLFKKREALVKKLHDTKRQIIRSDRRAAKIQREMQTLLKELTVILESREAVKEINAELKAVDAKLDVLPKKNAETK